MTKYRNMLNTYYSRNSFCDYSPLHIYVEPTNICNLSCSHCPQRMMKRKKGFMDMELYKKIVNECQDLSIKWIYLFHVGESTLHKNIDLMINVARNLGIKIRLHTNGTRDVSNFIVEELHISANQTDFTTIRFNIDKLVEKGIDFKLDAIEGITNKLPHTYKKYVKSKDFYNWQGSIVKNKGPDMETICSHPYKSLVVCWDGKCVPCCVDYDNNYIIGDANSASLEEIWNSDKMQQIRRKPMEICRFCNIQRIPEEEKTGDGYFVKHAMR